MNFLAAQARVIQKLSENTTPQYWTLDEIRYNLNLGYREFMLRTECRTRTILLTYVADGYYVIPSDLMAPKGLYLDGVPVDQTSRQYLDNQSTANRAGKLGLVGDGNTGVVTAPKVWLFDEGYIRVYPAPAENTDSIYAQQESGHALAGDSELPLTLDWGNFADKMLLFVGGILQAADAWNLAEGEGYTVVQLNTALLGAADWTLAGLSASMETSGAVTFRYVPRPFDMVSDTTSPSGIPPAFHDALVEYACYECFSREGDGQDQGKAAMYAQRFERYVQNFLTAFNREVVPDIALPFKV
jgi:hypothetical protein